MFIAAIVAGHFFLPYPDSRTIDCIELPKRRHVYFDILFIYFGKYLKLIYKQDKFDNDCYTMASNEISNDVISGA